METCTSPETESMKHLIRILAAVSGSLILFSMVALALNHTKAISQEAPESATMQSSTAMATSMTLGPNSSHLEAISAVKMEVVKLSASNTVVMDDEFTDESVTRVMQELKVVSEKLDKSDTIYLVLNTPGGSVSAGQSLISFCKGLPQEVKTLTIFAASMGFQTVQNLGERLILDSGTLMSHRAKFGVSGQGPGEIYSRLNYIMSMVDQLDSIAAARMGISFDEYRILVHDEYWVYGAKAVSDKAADRVVVAKCDKTLNGTRETSMDTIFGKVFITRAKCPLMPGVLGLRFEKVLDDEAKAKATKQATTLANDKEMYLRNYILQGN